MGLIAAGAKRSSVNWLRMPTTLYTTLIRSVPDLVLILLIFYSLQLWLNDLSEVFGGDYFEIDAAWPINTRRLSRAASHSVWRSHAHWRWSRKSFCSMNRPQRWPLNS
ncbi:histidine transport system permease protein HisQ [Pseudomonas antarctica]|uniref:Histidine transport system permease protein HisQ n=1 Tax=Pseudomonas antarctica TaxID=219572 RepID=A0ABQ7A3I1_9PSED|nr:histidine transport system permease protein HisQ [Pseudomonas antarctica]